MVKVLINRKPRYTAWGGGNHFVRAFYEHAESNNVKIVDALSDSPQVIFLFHPESEDGSISMQDAIYYKKNYDPAVKIVVRVNECDARKNTVGVDAVWNEMIERSNYVFFVSNWMRRYFISDAYYADADNEVIVNGIDRERFVKQEKISKTNNKTNIVCAHWSDNAMKGEDTYNYLDTFVSKNADFTFTYIGRTKAKLKNSIHLDPLDPSLLAKELTKYDVCVNGTYYDPGPNAVIESIVAGLPTFVRADGGGAAEFAGPTHTYQTFDELESILLSKTYEPNADFFLDWSTVMKKIHERIRSL